MKNSFLTTLLICSLLFNIILISFMIISSCNNEAERVLSRRNRIERAHKGYISEEIKEKREEFMRLRREFLAQLSKDNIDEDSLSLILDNLTAAQTDMELNIGKNLIEMRRNMTDEEAQEFFGRMVSRNRHIHNKHRR